MDLRIQKTRQNIFQAFIELREKYPLEKITVKELTERAQISKQTFYLHYRDMYDLSERIEQSMIQEMLKELPYPENILTHTGEVTKQLFQKAIDQGHNFRLSCQRTHRRTGNLPQKCIIREMSKIPHRSPRQYSYHDFSTGLLPCLRAVFDHRPGSCCLYHQ